MSAAPAPPQTADKGKAKAEEPSLNPSSVPSAVHEGVAILVIGMAGSGKTTFMQRVNSYLHSKQQPPYIINLDPAVTHLPFTANIDIRDTVDYQEVMKQCVELEGTPRRGAYAQEDAGTTWDRTEGS